MTSVPGKLAARVRIARTSGEFARYRAFVEAAHTHPAAAPSTFAAEEGATVSRLAVLHQDGEPLALIAGKLADTQQEWRLGYLKLGSTRARVFRVVTGGFLGEVGGDEEAKLLCEGLFDYLREGEADAVQLVGLPADSPLLREVMRRAGWFFRDRSVRVEPHWWLSLPASYQEFYRSRTSNTKSMIRQCSNRVSKKFAGNVEVRCYRQVEEIDRSMRDIEKVAAKTYQRAINVGFFASEQARRAWQHEAEQGWLAAFVLYLDGEPRAFWTGAVYRGTFTSYTTGFDPDFSYYHPGTFLLMRMIETFCSWGLEAIDFGSGESDYKRKFGTRNVEETSPLLFAPTFHGIRLALSSNALAVVMNVFRRLLNEQRRARLKNMWRQFLQNNKTESAPAAPAEATPPTLRSHVRGPMGPKRTTD